MGRPKGSKSIKKITQQELIPPEHSLKTRVITPKGIASFISRTLAVYAPHVIPEILEQIRLGAITGDPVMIEKGLKVYGMTENGKGITIQQINSNTANSQANAASAASTKSFDAVVRQLANQEQVDVIDAESTPA